MPGRGRPFEALSEMTRLLALIVLAILIWVFLQNLKQKVRISVGASRRSAAPPPQTSVENLVRCTACGVHVPRSRALPGAVGTEAVYCSERCRTVEPVS